MSSQELLVECDFIQKYHHQLDSLAKKILEEDYDIIISMSRKAPRLLEVLSYFGFDYGKPLVITEKAIYYLSKEYFIDKKILILDDIIIVGTTLFNNLTTKFDNKLEFCKNINILVLAVDSEWYQIKLFELLYKEGKISDLPSYEMSLDRKKTPIFCNEIVKSFHYPNKPYEIDWAILYLELEEEYFNSKEKWIDSIYDLSSAYNLEINRRNFTIVPNEKAINNFKKIIFSNPNKIKSDNEKCRIFFNTINNRATFVPTLKITIDNDDIDHISNVFNLKFDYFNKLINDVPAIEELDDYQRSRIKYLLLNYITSYLWGVYLVIRNNILLDYHNPKSFLKCKDLFYLFGPFYSKKIINIFNNSFNDTLNCFQLKILIEDDKSISNLSILSDVFDDPSKELYKDIRKYLNFKKKYHKGSYLIQFLASIFEGLFFKIELEVREKLINEIELTNKIENINTIFKSIKNINRLFFGFTWHQIVWIMNETGFIDDINPRNILRISLSLDFLIDLGVVVPIQYFNNKYNHWEYRYRVGEDPLCAEKTVYLFDTINKELPKIDRITREKIYVMLLEKARKEKYTEDILSPVKDKEIINLNIGLCIHGAVLQVNQSELFFSTWFKYPSTKEKFMKKDNLSYIPIEDECLADMISYAKTLTYIDNKINKKKDHYIQNIESRYLITLSTLYNHEIYFKALLKEIDIFFSEYKKDVKSPINILLDEVTSLKNAKLFSKDTGKDMKKKLNSKIRKRLSHSSKAINSLFLKKILFSNRKLIAQSIDDHFSRLTWNNTRIQYSSGINFSSKKKINNIINYPKPKKYDLIIQKEKELLALGNVCKQLSNIILLIKDIVILSMTRTKKRKLHESSILGIKKRLDELNVNKTSGIIKLKKGKKISSDYVLKEVKDMYKLSDSAYVFAINNDEWVIDDYQLDSYTINKTENSIKIRKNSLISSLDVKLKIFKNISRINYLHDIKFNLPSRFDLKLILCNFEDMLLILEDVYKTLNKYYINERKNLIVDIEERLFPLEMRNENFIILTYDIKQSSLPLERDQGQWTIEDLNKIIREEYQEEIKTNSIIIKTLHEEGYFLIRSVDKTSDILKKILQSAERNGKKMRVVIISTNDTVPFIRKRKYRYDDEWKIITDRTTDPVIDENYVVPARLIQHIKQFEDKQIINCLDEKHHTLAISRNVAHIYSFNNEIDDRLKFFKFSWTKNKEVTLSENQKIYDVYVAKPNYIQTFRNKIISSD